MDNIYIDLSVFYEKNIQIKAKFLLLTEKSLFYLSNLQNV
jgi:hypothetical protein